MRTVHREDCTSGGLETWRTGHQEDLTPPLEELNLEANVLNDTALQDAGGIAGGKVKKVKENGGNEGCSEDGSEVTERWRLMFMTLFTTELSGVSDPMSQRQAVRIPEERQPQLVRLARRSSHGGLAGQWGAGGLEGPTMFLYEYLLLAPF